MFNFKLTDNQLVHRIIKTIIIIFAVVVFEFFITTLAPIAVILVGVYCAYCIWTEREVKL